MKIDVTVEISTKNRYYTTLPMCLLSIAHQTYKPKKIIMFDDGDQKDLRNDPTYASIFALLSAKNIDFQCIFGKKQGQVHNHQLALSVCDTEWIWRVDDDNAPEPNVLERMISHIDDTVGAVSGLVLVPSDNSYPNPNASSNIEDIYHKPNAQWHRFEGIKEVDHLHNSFLFRKQAARHGYCMDLSPVGHREETLFTYEMRRAGYRLLVDGSIIIWHLRAAQGGIRSYETEFFWQHDEKIFQQKLAEFKIAPRQTKLIVLDNGLGDHFAFKMVLPEIKEKYKDKHIMLAVCYPDVFADESDVQLISIADAEKIDKDIDKYNVYRYMTDMNWKGKLIDAYRSMLL
jgi:glycosyltransferase involved in cell wall biosynthesis